MSDSGDTYLSDRRVNPDRRQNQVPFEGPERRKGERRSGTDRRAFPREG